MKKKNKIVALSALGLLCVFGGVFAANGVQASAENSYVKPEFFMDGASIRYSADNSGLRFSSAITDAEYEKLETLQESYDVSFGALIAPQSVLTGELTLENTTDEILNLSIEEPYHNTKKGIYEYRGVVSSIPNTEYLTEIAGVGYMQIFEKGTETLIETVYTDTAVRTVSYIAYCATQDAAFMETVTDAADKARLEAFAGTREYSAINVENGAVCNYKYGYEGQTINVTIPAQEGKIAYAEIVSGETSTLKTETSFSFTMPANAVTVNAVYATELNEERIITTGAVVYEKVALDRVASITLDGTAVTDYTLEEGVLTVNVASFAKKGYALEVLCQKDSNWYLVKAQVETADIVIGTAEEFTAFAKLLYPIDNATKGKRIVLSADIDYNNKNLNTEAPITDDSRFLSPTSRFDGLGYVISNLRVEGTQGWGIFREINGASIENVAFTNFYVESTRGLMGRSANNETVINNVYLQGVWNIKGNSYESDCIGIFGYYCVNPVGQNLVMSVDIQKDGSPLGATNGCTGGQYCVHYASGYGFQNVQNVYVESANTNGEYARWITAHDGTLYTAKGSLQANGAAIAADMNNSLWTVNANGELCFGNSKVFVGSKAPSVGATVVEEKNTVIVASNRANQQNFVYDTTATGIDTVTNVTFGGALITDYTFENGVLTIANSKLGRKVAILSIEGKKGTAEYVINVPTEVADYAVGTAAEWDAAWDAITAVTSNAYTKDYGYRMILTADIDYQGNIFNSNSQRYQLTYTGSELDGRGYVIKNLVSEADIGVIWATERSTIKNIGFINVKYCGDRGFTDRSGNAVFENVYIQGEYAYSNAHGERVGSLSRYGYGITGNNVVIDVKITNGDGNAYAFVGYDGETVTNTYVTTEGSNGKATYYDTNKTMYATEVEMQAAAATIAAALNNSLWTVNAQGKLCFGVNNHVLGSAQ